MKKFIYVLAFVTVIITTIISVQALVQQNENTKEQGYITVSATSNTELAPDITDISFTVLTEDTKSMQKASAQNKEISDKVYTLIKNMINIQNGDYIKTADFNATPVYTYNGSKKTFNKYQVTNRILVHTKMMDKTGNLVDNVINIGNVSVNNINFSVSDYDLKCNNLLVKASSDAYKRGNMVAKAMNSSVIGIRTLQTSCTSNNGLNYNITRLAKSSDMLATGSNESSPVNISGGLININASVTATLYVK